MIQFSIITSTKPKRLTKCYRLQDGELIKESGGQMFEGSVKLDAVSNLVEFADVLTGLSHNQALCYGVPKSLNIGSSKPVVKESNRNSGNLSRTNKDFKWHDGAGILFIDHDTGIEKDKLLQILADVLPEAKDVLKIWYPSSSSYIFNGKEQLTGVKGQRVYLVVDNAADIPRIGEIIHRRMWLAGHGFVCVSASGALLDRSAVDASVWQPNRLDFASGALCDKPLVQKRGEPDILSGREPFLKSAAVKNLTNEDVSQYKLLLSEERARLKPVSQKKQSEHIEHRIKDVPEDRRDEVRKFYQVAYHGGDLSGDFNITVFIDEQEIVVSIDDILTNPKKYDRCITLDPIEPEYNDYHRTGILYLSDGKPVLHSLAHGGRTFPLKAVEPTQRATNADKVINQMYQSLEQQESGKMASIPMPWNRLSGGCDAFRPKTVTIISGNPKAGKSFFTMNIIKHIHELGHTWAYLPLEDDVEAWSWRMMSVLDRDYTLTNIDKDTVGVRAEGMARLADQLKSYIKNVTENPRVGHKDAEGNTLIPAVTPAKVLNWLRRAARKARLVVIDPMSQIDFQGRNVWELEADFIRQACAIVQDAGCSLILICHNTKGSGKTGNERTLDDIQGSAMLTRLAHTAIIIDKIENEERDVIRVGGVVDAVECNRIVMIAAARNGSGTGSKLAFTQEATRPIFHEHGFLAPTKKKGRN